MGVADKKTYKDQYHFRDDYKDTAKENPSIDGIPRINQTIKENPYRSNVEIEGGEVVLLPDLSALFKAKGKTHKQGGMDVLLKPDSFVFSDFKNLAITDKDKELFELKMGGSSSPIKNTPAEVVKKNVPIKHYNTLINNITQPYKDDLARKSSAMMLEKYIGTLGNIAFIQERKKKFPDGLPSFSLGTAPVYDPDLKNQIDEGKQYMKYGGPIDKCPCGKDAQGNCNPCTSSQIAELLKKATKGTTKDITGMNKIGSLDNTDLYHVGTDPTKSRRQTPGPKMSNDEWKKFINTPAGQQWLKKYNASTPGSDKLISITNELPTIPPDTFDFKIKPPMDSPKQYDVQGNPQGPKRADWDFTPWQKISQLYNWGQYANVKRYMPYRSRYNATYADPHLLNPEQTIGDIKGMANQQISSLNTLNPIMRNAQASQAYGQALNQIPGIRSQYDNQNAQITNQFRQYNNQVRNNESLINMQNDQVYYTQAIEGRKNFDNMRSHTANNAMNNTLRDVETNQKLAYNLLTQKPLTNGKNPYDYDWRTGSFIRNPMDIRDVQSNDGTTDYLSKFINQQAQDWDKMSYTERNNLMKIMTAKGFVLPPSGPNLMEKKGGKVKHKNRNPYKY